jgi:hypothetical protein
MFYLTRMATAALRDIVLHAAPEITDTHEELSLFVEAARSGLVCKADEPELRRMLYTVIHHCDTLFHGDSSDTFEPDRRALRLLAQLVDAEIAAEIDGRDEHDMTYGLVEGERHDITRRANQAQD